MEMIKTFGRPGGSKQPDPLICDVPTKLDVMSDSPYLLLQFRMQVVKHEFTERPHRVYFRDDLFGFDKAQSSGLTSLV